MKRIIFPLMLLFAVLNLKAESALPAEVVLTPYIVNDVNTPKADKILLDKLNRIVTQYGVASSSGVQTPFIITAHATELGRETTATAPPQTVINLSVTFYIGNGEEGTVFSTCNMEVKGIGSSLDQAYSSAYKKINVNDPFLVSAIAEGRTRIAKYYEQAGPGLIKKAEAYALAADWSNAYATLLRIPPVCPQYKQAQNLILEYVQKESDANNGDVIARARAAWSASPDESGASRAQAILAEMDNASPKMREQANALMKEMSSRLQSVADAERAAEQRRQDNAHAERIAEIKGAAKVAAAKAKSAPRVVYHIHWW